MSEETKFRVSSITISVGVLIAIIGAIIAGVQKFDTLSFKVEMLQNDIATMNKTAESGVEKLQSSEAIRDLAVADLSKRVDAQGGHILVDEQRENSLEGKLDATIALLGVQNKIQPTPTPSPAPH